MMPTIVNFKVSSELKNVIGRDLITDDFVAIFELVKNSFDANASKVQLIFDFTYGKEAIYLIDNGKGMSEKDLKNKWLFVAYSAKKEGIEDEGISRRHYAGNKGVGRFSCDRLGRLLYIESKVKTESQVNTLEVDWGDFEKKSTNEFGTIPVKLDKRDDFSIIKRYTRSTMASGVILKITQLREPLSWTKDKMINLKRALSKLLDPFNGEVSRRAIEIISPAHTEADVEAEKKSANKNEVPILINGNVENNLFDLLKTKSTSLKAKIEDGLLKVELDDRGVVIYKTEETIGEEYPQLLDSRFDAIIAYLNTSAKNTFKRRMGIASVAYGSLFLVKNEFRVYPIGEEFNDFWGLDRRKQQGYNRYLGTREVLGRVKIESEDDNDVKFRESSSRDKGLIDTPALAELKDCVMHCLRKLEAYVTAVSWQDELDKLEETASRLSLDINRQRIIQLIEKLSLSSKVVVTDYNHDLVSVLESKTEGYEDSLMSLRKIAERKNDIQLLGKIDDAEAVFAKKQRALEKAEKIARNEQMARQKAETQAIAAMAKAKKNKVAKDVAVQKYEEEQKRNLFLAASADRDKEVLEGFLHQITICTVDSKAALENALIELKTGDFSKEKFRDIITDQIELLENISTLSKFGTYANFRLNSGKINADISSFIKQYIEKVAIGFESRIEIECSNVGHPFVTTFNPMEIGMVLDNLISNSKKARATKFVINIDNSGCNLLLEITDNGKGITDSKERIFEKGFTRTNGSGIGLYFCKKLLQQIGASIELALEQPAQGATFLIRIKNET